MQDTVRMQVTAHTLSGTPDWNPITTTGAPPIAWQRQSAVYDSHRDRMVVFGGSYFDGNLHRVDTSHALDFTGPPTWTLLATSGESPPAIDTHSAVFDAPRDRMVVFGQGDEITIEFDVPKEPAPEGWTRDFLLYNSGWDKDADLHIIHGQTVEPLPFQKMTGYPFTPEEDYPDTPATREYLQKYQTRTQPRAHFWRRLHQVAE